MCRVVATGALRHVPERVLGKAQKAQKLKKSQKSSKILISHYKNKVFEFRGMRTPYFCNVKSIFFWLSLLFLIFWLFWLSEGFFLGGAAELPRSPRKSQKTPNKDQKAKKAKQILISHYTIRFSSSAEREKLIFVRRNQFLFGFFGFLGFSEDAFWEVPHHTKHNTLKQ